MHARRSKPRPKELGHALKIRAISDNMNRSFNRIFSTKGGNFKYGLRNFIAILGRIRGESGILKGLQLELKEPEIGEYVAALRNTQIPSNNVADLIEGEMGGAKSCPKQWRASNLERINRMS